MKTCNRCSEAKDIECFAKNGKLGRHPVCKVCRAEIERLRRIAEPDRIRGLERARIARDPASKKAAIKRHYEANRAARLEKEKIRYTQKSEQIKQRAAEYRAANKDKVRAWNGTRRAIQRLAMPPWADRSEIARIYKEASRKWAETGIPHHVDHVIPLQGRLVCGLHVPGNLQVLTQEDNLKKGARFDQ